ncbi:hypothetical protein ABVT39_004811, partial [Epinephelus coioides]
MFQYTVMQTTYGGQGFLGKEEQLSLVETEYEVVGRNPFVSKACTDVHLNLSVRRRMRKID